LASLLSLAVFSALWAPELWDKAGILQSKETNRESSMAKVRTENDSPSIARRDGTSGASVATGVILADGPARDHAVMPGTSPSPDVEPAQENNASASSKEPHGAVGDSEAESARTGPGASEHPVAQNGASENDSSSHTNEVVATTRPHAGNAQVNKGQDVKPKNEGHIEGGHPGEDDRGKQADRGNTGDHGKEADHGNGNGADHGKKGDHGNTGDHGKEADHGNGNGADHGKKGDHGNGNSADQGNGNKGDHGQKGDHGKKGQAVGPGPS